MFCQIHSEKRNRLEHKKMHDLVYSKYNQKLHERRSRRDEFDPISLDGIDECNEWLIGKMDDGDDLGKDYVFDGETLEWQTVFEASGLEEPTKLTRSRSTTGKRKETLSKDVRASKKGTPASTSKGKGKVISDIVDDDEDQELEVDEEEDEYAENDESEGEEGEGFAAWEENEEDDYIGVDDED